MELPDWRTFLVEERWQENVSVCRARRGLEMKLER